VRNRVAPSDVGGIPEAVADGVTGSLVHYHPDDPAGYQDQLAEAINSLVADPENAEHQGRSGRQRCTREFSWARIAEQTLETYWKVRVTRASWAFGSTGFS
jgi:starch synthase